MFSSVLPEEERKYPLPISTASIRPHSETKVRGLLHRKNYSELRKHVERDFFISSHSMVFEDRKNVRKQEVGWGRNGKRGRLWLGRPVIMFPGAPNSIDARV